MGCGPSIFSLWKEELELKQDVANVSRVNEALIAINKRITALESEIDGKISACETDMQNHIKAAIEARQKNDKQKALTLYSKYKSAESMRKREFNRNILLYNSKLTLNYNTSNAHMVNYLSEVNRIVNSGIQSVGSMAKISETIDRVNEDGQEIQQIVNDVMQGLENLSAPVDTPDSYNDDDLMRELDLLTGNEEAGSTKMNHGMAETNKHWTPVEGAGVRVKVSKRKPVPTELPGMYLDPQLIASAN